MGTTKVVYVGNAGEGEGIAEAGVWAELGEAVEVDSGLAERLLEQDKWARPNTNEAKEAAALGARLRKARAAEEKAAVTESPPAGDTTSEEGS